MGFKNNLGTVEVNAETGIATLTMKMAGKVNKLNAEFGEGLLGAVDWLEAQQGIRGLVITTGHKDFCVGADIDMLYLAQDPGQMLAGVLVLTRLYRRIETLPFPVVAALTGSALGGGYELALACHHRVALSDFRVLVGLPECTIGVFPGAGGTQRLPRMIGVQAALEIITVGKTLRAPKALGPGLVDALAETPEQVLAAASAWCLENAGAKQPWDRSDFQFPDPQPSTLEFKQLFIGAAAFLQHKTSGVFKAPIAVMQVVQEGAGMAFERALELEARHFVAIALGDQAKDMVRTLWYHRTAAEKLKGLPVAQEHGFTKVGILGAGMMGASLAVVTTLAGLEVVLKDIRADALEKARSHCQKQIAKLGRRLSEPDRKAALDRITCTLQDADLSGCDLIIEAVLEDIGVKHRVTQQIEPYLAPGAIWASNTSALPITRLAEGFSDPTRFIGLHFFSPVEKMPLLEVILGDKTSDETLGRCLALGRALKKTHIVVNDHYAFYTSRVFGSYIIEGLQLVAEGHDPVLVEAAARRAGMVVPPLKVFDEISLTLGRHMADRSDEYADPNTPTEGVALLLRLVDEFGRTGKAGGGGFYDYGDKRQIWPGLRNITPQAPTLTGLEHLQDRLMLAQVNQVAWTLELGIVRNKRDAEVGALFGIGFAPQTGGPLAFMDRYGLPALVAQLDRFAVDHGARYAPPDLLRNMAERGERFFAVDAVP
jgi:3-hydroxyacyl-CoA dehydrogenase/enoyl-CoA hydratase/3-hydroxybutyryl-CoA epimerase